MYNSSLSYEDWKSEALRLLRILNNQFKQVSVDGISFEFDYTEKEPPIRIYFPHRGVRFVMEGLISEVLQGICYVESNSCLLWRYTK